ncbi:MAG: hypothetical protein IJA67_04305 [Oscillospiraceae bacterium]|nr:hypothetical protein [Oscillospiraceae bacterium]
MKAYFLEAFSNREDFIKFLAFMLSESDSFSLVYFRRKENEKLKSKAKTISEGLKKFKLSSRATQSWPNTETLDFEHSYKLVMYAADMECLDVLSSVENLYDWNYPAPMDLCFYRNGYCWLAVTGHEQTAYLYTDSQEDIHNLEECGANLSYAGEEIQLFQL